MEAKPGPDHVVVEDIEDGSGSRSNSTSTLSAPPGGSPTRRLRDHQDFFAITVAPPVDKAIVPPRHPVYEMRHRPNDVRDIAQLVLALTLLFVEEAAKASKFVKIGAPAASTTALVATHSLQPYIMYRQAIAYEDILVDKVRANLKQFQKLTRPLYTLQRNAITLFRSLSAEGFSQGQRERLNPVLQMLQQTVTLYWNRVLGKSNLNRHLHYVGILREGVDVSGQTMHAGIDMPLDMNAVSERLRKINLEFN